jgi:geranylgeranyl diphosphate synthase type II
MNEKIKKYILQIDREVQKLSFGTYPENLYDPIRYILRLGGKRIRPLLTILAYALYHKNYSHILSPALAVEVFHNFTLLHDDIMDNAPLRRGKPTVHNQWDENIAILSGDVMLVRVYDLLLLADNDLIQRIIRDFNNCAARVCEGQQLDMDYEARAIISEEEYLNMITLKTAVLLGFSLSFGGILARAEESDNQRLYDIGINLGTGFQLMDDLLDVYADQKKFGKQMGGDIITNKKTFLLIKALELTSGDDLEELEKWIRMKNFDPEEKIRSVKRIYDQNGIREITSEKINQYITTAHKDLDKLSVAENQKKNLRELMEYLINREI